MDEQAGVLFQFIAALHTITTRAHGRRWDAISGNSRKCVNPYFAFSRENKDSIPHTLKTFVEPKKQQSDFTEYYFVGTDRRGWATLLRLVRTGEGLINTEIVMLSQKAEGLHSIGYRFEHPEAKGGDNHRYFHAQPIRRSASDSELPPALGWLPDHSPTFFVPAKGWVDLVLYAIHACCGVAAIRELWTSPKLKGYKFLEELATQLRPN